MLAAANPGRAVGEHGADDPFPDGRAVSPETIANEALLLVVGAGVGVGMNLYIPERSGYGAAASH